MNKYYRFALAYTKNPKSIGSVIPSSNFLGKAMANAAKASTINGNMQIIEIGAGTGSITNHLKAVCNNVELIIFEPEHRLFDKINKSHNNSKLYCKSIPCLEFTKHSSNPCIIISSLPFRSIDNKTKIVKNI